MEWLNLMVSEPYYLSHFMAFFSYLVVRSSAIVAISPDVASRLFHREIQAILAFSVLSLVKMVRKETWEALIADLLLYAKILFVALTLIMDYHLALWFIALFAAIHIFTQQPLFQKLGTCSKLTPLQLEALLTEGNTSRYWLVEFRVSFSADCIRASSCFPELSITYSNKNLSFGIVDLGVFPNVAEKFGISIGGSGSSHVPTYILFEKASEIARFPDYDFEAKPPPSLTKKLLCRHFELDRLLLEYVNGK